MRAFSTLLTALFAALLSLGVSAQNLDSLRRQAEEGDLASMNYLGYLLISGGETEGEAVERDPAEGLLWLIRAASEGDVKAASNLGWLYVEGSLVEQDLDAGVRWLSKAADAGLPVAQSLLGDLYRDGTGVAPDSLMADSLYRRAFEGGLADAGYKLYDLNSPRLAALTPEELVEQGRYFYLRGAPSVGVKLFYMAADQGSAEAMALLGDAYTRALGVPYDHSLSLKYYVEAARAGNPSAQFVVGELLEIFPDSLKGHPEWESLPDSPTFWLEKAAEAGVFDAAEAYSRLLPNSF